MFISMELRFIHLLLPPFLGQTTSSSFCSRTPAIRSLCKSWSSHGTKEVQRPNPVTRSRLVVSLGSQPLYPQRKTHGTQYDGGSRGRFQRKLRPLKGRGTWTCCQDALFLNPQCPFLRLCVQGKAPEAHIDWATVGDSWLGGRSLQTKAGLGWAVRQGSRPCYEILHRPSLKWGDKCSDRHSTKFYTPHAFFPAYVNITPIILMLSHTAISFYYNLTGILEHVDA